MKLNARGVLLAAGLCGSLLCRPVSAAEKIYLAPDDHTDYLWKLDEAGYEDAFVAMLDYYLDQIDATAGLPAGQQARWNCDGSFWVRAYEKRRGSAGVERLMARVRDGHITVPLNTLVSTYGGQPTEAVLRGMYYAGSLERRFGVRFPLALAMENQTLPLGLGSLFAGAGARYSWRGICACASKVPTAGSRDREIYRWTGLDGTGVILKWNSVFTSGSQHLGGYAEARDPAAMVDFLSGDARYRARWPYAVHGAFGKGWDDPQTLTREFVDVAQKKTTAEREVVVSNEVDFFTDFEARYGKELPKQALAFGNEWDLYAASLSEVSASVRRAVEGLRGGEALAALVARGGGGDLWARQRAAREDAHQALGLYWEHNWTADGPISKDVRAAWQRRLATGIGAYSQGLTKAGIDRLGALIRGGPGLRFAVFNPLGFARTDAVDVPYAPDGTQAPKVITVDDGAEAPAQVVTVAGARRLRVLARDVPALGYRVVQVLTGETATALPAAATSNAGAGTLEDERYQLTVDTRGALTSLRWKPGSRELAQAQGTAGDTRFLNDLGPAAAGTLAVIDSGPVSVTLQATAPGPLAHTTRVTLTREVDRIAIENEITQNFSDVRSWGFGLRLSAPQVVHEEVGAVLRARYAKDGGHYADRNARTDWLTLNHFLDMSGADAGVTLSSADLSFFRLGQSTPTTLDTTMPLVSILAGGQVDGPALGIMAQGGDRRFLQRFALRGHGAFGGGPGDTAEAMRFALAHQNPLLAVPVSGGDRYPADRYGALTVSDPRVLLWALKPAEDGEGTVARLWNLAAEPVTVTLRAAEPLGIVRQLTHLETRTGDLAVDGAQVTLTLAAQQIVTLALGDGAGAGGTSCGCRGVGARAGEGAAAGLGGVTCLLGALLLRRSRRSQSGAVLRCALSKRSTRATNG